VVTADDAGNEFRGWLLDEMRTRKWNQAELARRTGVLPSVISRWISRDWLPDGTSCSKLADAFGLDWQFVMVKAGHSRPNPIPTSSDAERLIGMVRRVNWSVDKTRLKTVEVLLLAFLDEDDVTRQGEGSDPNNERNKQAVPATSPDQV
jgi:transcriptional regulator with XRE-family HTH domain